MPEQPRVFISSTIKEFKDLRSALKFWLEEAGYQVFLSECNDFPVDPTSSTFKNCLDVLRSSHYVLLLIGYCRGCFYDETRGVSVTRAEYQTAYEMVKVGKLKLVSFVRAEVEEDLRSGNLSNFEDPRFTEEFLAEVKRDEEVRSGARTGGPFPRGNWVSRFREFRDITQALSGSLRIAPRLRKRAIEANLLREQKLNLKEMLTKAHNGSVTGFPPRFERLQQELRISPHDFVKTIELSKKQATQLAYLAVALGGFGTQWIATSGLDEAINSGEFLEFDVQADQFKVGELHASLLDLRREIVALRSMHKKLDVGGIVLDVLENFRRKTSIGGKHLAFMFSFANTLHNVRARTISLAAFLIGRSSEILPLDLAPQTPFGEEEAQALKAEKLTDHEIDMWLSKYGG